MRFRTSLRRLRSILAKYSPRTHFLSINLWHSPVVETACAPRQGVMTKSFGNYYYLPCPRSSAVANGQT